jgi:transposase
VVLEATSNAWLLYDELEPLVGSVTVAHPLAVKLIAADRVKTDSRDTIKLAHLLEALLVPAVWVPPVPVRELRALVSLSLRLVNQRMQVRNRFHVVLHRHNLAPPQGQPFAAHQQQWWLSLDLSSSEKLRVQQDLSLLCSPSGTGRSCGGRAGTTLDLRPLSQAGAFSGPAAWSRHAFRHEHSGRHR